MKNQQKGSRMKLFKRSVVVLILVCLTCPALAAEDKAIETLRSTSKAFSQIAKTVTPAVVAVKVEK